MAKDYSIRANTNDYQTIIDRKVSEIVFSGK
jgi:hypothetical protein